MGVAQYLAMTAAELRCAGELPEKIAWMGCHFSPYGLGLSNLPPSLPQGSVLILDDITPIRGHDPVLIGEQLVDYVERLRCAGVLLDFQRPGFAQSAVLAKHLSDALSCPVAVSEPYCKDLSSAVFLPPVPCHLPLSSYLAPWQGRRIWLEAALDGEVITLTREGCTVTPLARQEPPAEGFTDEQLHCHYKTELTEEAARFTLWRTREDLAVLQREAQALGVTHSIGLYQEFCPPAAAPLEGSSGA